MSGIAALRINQSCGSCGRPHPKNLTERNSENDRVWKQRCKVDTKTTTLQIGRDVGARTLNPVNLKKCPCSQTHVPVSQSPSHKHSSLRPSVAPNYAKIRLMMKLYRCLEPKPVGEGTSSSEPQCVERQMGYYPETLFLAMVDEIKLALCSNSLENYCKMLEQKKQANPFSVAPLETLLEMLKMPVDALSLQVVFFVTQLMIRAMCRKEMHRLEITYDFLSYRKSTERIDKSTVVFPKEFLPDDVTSDMLVMLYEAILKRMQTKENIEEILPEWIADPETFQGPNLLDLEAVQSLCIAFVFWSNIAKDMFLKKFVPEVSRA